MSTRENNPKQRHKYFMELAFHQARKILGNTCENPAVGCAIVKNNVLVNLAHTNFKGRPHAESIALHKKTKRLKNLCLYSTLEPCSHYGKTKPCTNIIIKKKIKSVYFSSIDPDKRSSNKSRKILSQKKIKVISNLSKNKGNYFYRDFNIRHKTKNIFISSKLATSKDFFISQTNNKWITNHYSRGRVHLMRASHDAILTTSKTVLKDNPSLNCRINGLEKFSPSRFILDKNLKIKVTSKIFKLSNQINTFVFFNKLNRNKINRLKKIKVKPIMIGLKNNNLDFDQIIYFMRSRGFYRVFVEAGITFNNFLLKNNYINDFYHFYSNNFLKKKGIYNARLLIKKINKIKKNKNEIKVNLCDDKLLKYYLK